MTLLVSRTPSTALTEPWSPLASQVLEQIVELTFVIPRNVFLRYCGADRRCSRSAVDRFRGGDSIASQGRINTTQWSKVGCTQDFINKTTPVLFVSGWKGAILSKKADKLAWWKGCKFSWTRWISTLTPIGWRKAFVVKNSPVPPISGWECCFVVEA